MQRLDSKLQRDSGFATAISKRSVSEAQATDISIDEEVAGFFHKIIVDGRYIEEWANDPAGVAANVGVSVSKAALQRIREINGDYGVMSLHLATPSAFIPIVVGVVKTTVIICVVICPGFNVSPDDQEISVIQPDSGDLI